MQRNWSLTSLPIAILAFTMLLVSASSSAQAQGLTFDNVPDWLAAITGTPSDALSSATIVDPNTTCIELDPTQGQLEGYLIKSNNIVPPIVSLFDGDTLVGTINHDTSPLTLDVFAFVFGFVNTDGLNVTKIVIEDNSPNAPSISCVDVSFTPVVVEPPALPADILIPMLVGDIEDLIDSDEIGQGQGNPVQNFLNQALKEINKGKIDKAIDKLLAASARIENLIVDDSLSAEEGQAIIDSIDALLLELLGL